MISNGGVVNSYGSDNYNGSGYIGYTNSNNNSARVTDTGSVWNVSGDLYVGSAGAGNSLMISNGGQVVVSGYGYVGSGSGGSNNSALVTGSNSVWNIAGLVVGISGAGSSLVINNGGQVAVSGYGYVGYEGSSNSVLVTRSNSVWNIAELYVGYYGAGNSLLISNGGQVVNYDGYVGYEGSSNSVLVTGTGSVWNNSGSLTVGESDGGNRLVISNGGQVVNVNGYVGEGTDTNVVNNSVLVSGSGSVWRNQGTLTVGGGSSSNLLEIAGGVVLADNLFISDPNDDDGQTNGGLGLNNLVRVNSGSLVVTNAAGNASLVVGHGGGEAELILNSGTVTADALIATNGTNSVVTFNGGLLKSRDTAVTNGAVFAVGNGVGAAEFHLLGGVHSFANGLHIRPNAVLSGCGTINGSVVVDSNALVRADCGGTLTFTGILTNNGTLRAVNGSVLEFYGPVVNNGIIDIMDGTTNFHSSFTNNGTVVDASYFRVVSIMRQAADINVTWTTVGGNSYVAQVTAGAADGSYSNNFTDLSLAIAIPGSGLGTTNYLDVGGATNMPARFYRIRLSSPMPADP